MILLTKIFLFLGSITMGFYILHTTVRVFGYLKAIRWVKKNNLSDIVSIKVIEE